MVDDKRVEGKTEDVTGRMKEGVGKATGNERMQREGRADQASGKVKDTAGKIKDDVKDTLRR